MELTAKHRRYFELAKRMARKSNHYQYKLGCVIVNRGRIVGIGINKLKTHPRSWHDYSMIHAELDAILSVPVADLKDATVYVYRQTKAGELALAKPCRTCQKMLRDCNIRKVCYTTDGGYDFYNC